MIYVKDLKKDIFPSSFLNFLPENCESCGSSNEVVETLSSLQCSNKNCISKVGYRLFSLLRDLGILLLSVDDCICFLEKFDTTNPYSIFLYNPEEDGELFEGFGIKQSNIFYKEINKKRGMLLWEFVKIGNFENLKISAEKLLDGYTKLSEFYTDLANGGIPFIQNLLLEDTDYTNIDNSICVDAVLIYEIFIMYKEELEVGLKGVVILNPDIKISVLFANNVSEYSSNRDFLYEINKKLQNKIYLYPVYNLNISVDLVYWEDLGLNTYNSIIEKVKTEYQNIKIVDSENIYDVLLEVLS